MNLCVLLLLPSYHLCNVLSIDQPDLEQKKKEKDEVGLLAFFCWMVVR